jgi:hypothetical protein
MAAFVIVNLPLPVFFAVTVPCPLPKVDAVIPSDAGNCISGTNNPVPLNPTVCTAPATFPLLSVTVKVAVRFPHPSA